MRHSSGIATSIIAIYIAVALQASVAPRIAILGVVPDFGLMIVAVLSLFTSRPVATVSGFFTGAFEGALSGVNLTHYVISRTLVGFFGGSASSFGFQPNAAVAALVTAILTVASQLLLFFLAPPSGIGRFLGDTIGTAMYNGVLAIPVYALLRRILATPGS